MIPVLIEGPALEPLTLAEAKFWLKVDGSEEDDLIRALIVAARLMVEAEIGQVLIGQTWRLIGDQWPVGERIPIKPGPLLGVVAARVFDAGGQASTVPVNSFTVLAHGEPPAVVPSLRPAPGRAFGGLEIDLRLGFGEAAADVPESIRLAVRRLVALWFDNRGEGTDPDRGVPPQIRALLRPFRPVRL
jgi:uncharacterized phiE125 gp8 family phage protein